MKLQNVRKAIKNTNNIALDIMTKWENVCKNTTSPEKDFDYIPVTEKNVVSCLNVKDKSEYKRVTLNDAYFIDKKDDLIVVLERMYELYNLNQITFLIVGDPNNPIGVINHSDLNSLPFLHLIWDVVYNFEIKLTNSIKDRYDNKYIEKKLNKDGRKAYNEDKNNSQELAPIFYPSLHKKIMLYNSLPETNKIHATAYFRNNIAHPKTKARVISKKSEISELYETLIEIDNFLSL